MASTTKYASVVSALGLATPTWVSDPDDKLRVAAYDGYDAMYGNDFGTFRLSMRGTEDKPVYIPSARKIVEATARYLGKGWAWTVASLSPDAQQANADAVNVTTAFNSLFVREEFLILLNSLRRNFLKRGDALLHIKANLGAPAGQRLSITELSARTVFPIPRPDDETKWVGCYIVDLLTADDGRTQIARRQEYRYDPVGNVTSRLTFWEPGAWDDRWVGHPPLKAVAAPAAYAQDPNMQALMSGVTLPASVRTIPVYLFRNRRDSTEPWGVSQISGVETLIAAVNQAATDEDVTLALQGLGAYVTDADWPIDPDTGEETDWEISPGNVLKVKTGSTFARISGVSTVVPFQDHLSYLDKEMKEASGLSNTAIGQVDAAVVASGVALRLDMAPILAQNEESETEILGQLDRMFFDLLTMWFPVDGMSVPAGIQVLNSFNDPLPVDRAGIIAEVTALVTNGLMSREFAIQYLTAKLGFQFPADMLQQVAAEQDTIGARLLAELEGGGIGPAGGLGRIGDPSTQPSAAPALPAEPTAPAPGGAVVPTA